MRKEQHFDVNARRTAFRENERSNGSKIRSPQRLPSEIEAAFPYLEKMSVGLQKHPYAALGAMITVAGIVVAAVVTVAVSVFTGLFLMYGTMKETTANQIQIQASLVAIQKQQTDDMNAIRAYESNRARRTELIVGMLSPEAQKAVAQWDRSNPSPELPTPRKD